MLRMTLGAALMLAAGSATAQSWPAKPLKIVVMAAPGGLVDIAARTLSTHMSKTFGQPVVVENRPGGGGNIATDYVAKQPADGTTLLSTGLNHAVNQTLLPNPGFDYEKDIAPVSMVAVGNMLLVASSSVPANNLQDLVALAKQKPGAFSIGHAPIGTPGHVAAELLIRMAGMKMELVTYKGIGAIVPDVVSGQIQTTIAALPALMPLVKAGRLKPIAMTGARRDAAMPDVPTVAESGVPGFDVTTWVCIMTTGGTPQPVIRQLNAEIRRVMALQEVRETFEKQGTEASTSTPEELGALMKMEATRWSEILKVRK